MQFPGRNTVFDRYKMSLSDAVCREDLRIDGHNSPDEKESSFSKSSTIPGNFYDCSWREPDQNPPKFLHQRIPAD